MTSLGSCEFFSITPDQIELESRQGHQWTPEDLPNRMICDMTSFDQLRDLKTSDLTLTRGQHLTVASPEQKVYHSTRLSKANTTMSKSWFCGHFFAKLFTKNQTRCLGHVMKWGLAGRDLHCFMICINW